jgi:flagellar hook assembly protein FlgD
MATKTISVYRALEEKKILKDRIDKLIFKNYAYISYAKKSDKTIGGKSIEDSKKVYQSNYESIKKLIKHLAAYSSAISQSNATTAVTIAEKEYTVAEAIARYQCLHTEMDFVNTLANQVASAQNTIKIENEKLLNPEAISKYISNILGDSKKEEEMINKLTLRYRNENEYILIDPNELSNNIDNLIEDVQKFKNEFHVALNQSNATTEITIELED